MPLLADSQRQGSPPSTVRGEIAARTLTPAAVFWLIMAGAIAALALAGVSALRPLRFNLPLLAHTSGLLAGYGVIVMVALMSRAPALGTGGSEPTGWPDGTALAAGPSFA